MSGQEIKQGVVTWSPDYKAGDVVKESGGVSVVAGPDHVLVSETWSEEKVNHPKHYNQHPSGVEAIDIVEHMSLPRGAVPGAHGVEQLLGLRGEQRLYVGARRFGVSAGRGDHQSRRQYDETKDRVTMSWMA